ncbi:MAG TPA: sialidase family protein [Sphingobacterium sp.]|nr:sialidase family protein [Sphingobacterium sp.]
MKPLHVLIICLISAYADFVRGQSNENYRGGVRIAWDYSSQQQLSEKGGYPRLIRLQDSSLIVIYETYTGDIYLKKSEDEGRSWVNSTKVFAQFNYADLQGKSTLVKMSNPEIIQLKNEDIILACNYRPVEENIAPYTIVIRRSTDRGETWLPPQTLYVAAPRFKDGCWEPSFLELPNGELQIYFANENPYRNSDEQEISMLSSKDRGKSWSTKAKMISFRKNKRDGMPVPIVKNNEIIIAIEDNKRGEFKPFTVRTKLEDNWKEPVFGQSKNREYALNEHIDDSIYMGAPYLLNLPNGQTLLSYQTNGGRARDWELSTLETAIGDENGRNFQHRTRPFRVSKEKQAKWSSIALWDEHTVVALTSTDFKTEHQAPWMIKGHIIPNTIYNNQEEERFPVFIGGLSKSNVKAKINKKGENIRVTCQVEEDKKFLSSTSGIFLYFLMNGKKYRIWAPRKGDSQLFRDEGDKWHPLSNFVKVESKVHSKGYNLIFNLPCEKEKNSFKLGLALSSCTERKEQYTEFLIHMEEKDVDTWLKFVW